MLKRQVLVVGSGPAGSTAAFYLAKAGVDVLLVDKETWPRDKICGDGQSSVVWPIYKDMGIFDEMQAMSLPGMTGHIWSGADEVITKMIGKEPWIFCSPRRKVDDLTRLAAIEAGADFMENYEACHIIKKRGQVVGVKGLYRGKPMDIMADIVVVAAGSHSQLARELGSWSEDNELIFYGARGYFENVNGMDERCCEEAWLPIMAPSGYMWVFPEAGGNKRANVGVFLTEKALRKSGMRLEDYFAWWRDETKIGKERLGEAKLIGEIKGWRLPTSREIQKNYFAGAICIGDSANMVDCAFGGGYNWAMQAGQTVGLMLPGILAKGDYSEEAMSAIYYAMEGPVNSVLKSNAIIRKYMTDDPEGLVGILEFVRSLPDYPNIAWDEVMGLILTQYLNVGLDVSNLLNPQSK